MATSNRIRALNRLPFDFQDGLKVAGVDVTALNQIATANGAGLVGVTPVGGVLSTNVQAALAELDTKKIAFTRLDDTDGSSLVGYDGGTVQDALDAVTGPNGAASVGYTPAGVGAVVTTVQGKLQEMVSVFDFMTDAEVQAVKTNTWTTVSDVTAKIQKALDSAIDIFFPRGTYKITAPLVQKNTFILRGEGGELSKITSATSDIFHLGKVGGYSNNSVIQNLGLISMGGGGHIFVQKSMVLLYQFKNLYIEQLNQNKSIYSHTANLGNFLWNLWEGGRYFHSYGATVPGFHFVVDSGDGATNANTWRNIDFVRASKPWFYFESARANNYIHDLTFDRISFSVTGGGCFVGKGVNSITFNDCSIYDLEFGGNLNSANLFEFYRGTNVSNQPSRHITFRCLRRIVPDSQLNGYQDIYFDKPASGYSVEQVQFYSCSQSVTSSLFVTTNTGAVLDPISYQSRLAVTGDPIPRIGSSINNARVNGVAQTLELSGTVSNYPLEKSCNVVFCEPIGANRNLTGIKLEYGLPASPLVPMVYIYNKSTTHGLVLVHDTSSTEANRFYCPGAANITVSPLSGKTLVYNHEFNRWCVL